MRGTPGPLLGCFKLLAAGQALCSKSIEFLCGPRGHYPIQGSARLIPDPCSVLTSYFASPPHTVPYLNSLLALNHPRSLRLLSSHHPLFQTKPRSFLLFYPLSSPSNPFRDGLLTHPTLCLRYTHSLSHWLPEGVEDERYSDRFLRVGKCRGRV